MASDSDSGMPAAQPVESGDRDEQAARPGLGSDIAEGKDEGHGSLGCALAVIAWFAAALALLGFLIAVGAWLGYSVRFSGDWLGSGSSVEQWVRFSSAVMPMVQTVIAFATLAVAAYIGLTINESLETRRRADENARVNAANRASRNRELLRLSELLVDTDFYAKVTYPAWEVALKWLTLEGEAGHLYRAQVVAGEIALPNTAYTGDGDFAFYVRNHPHTRPYDVKDGTKHPACALGELPEALAFATWMRFWRHIQFLVEEDFLDAEGVRKLFREWYVWWAAFMSEYIEVTLLCQRCLKQPEEKDSSLFRVRDLQVRILDIPLHKYHGTAAAFRARVKALAGGIVPKLKAGLETAAPAAPAPPVTAP